MTIKASRIEIDPHNTRGISIDIDENEVFEAVDISDFIKHHGTSEILKEIDVDTVKEYFNLTDKD